MVQYTIETAIHTIQLQILTKLMKSPAEQRYSELMILGIENDLFNYHLQQLVKTGLVNKNEARYSLTEIGQKSITHLDALGNPRDFLRFLLL